MKFGIEVRTPAKQAGLVQRNLSFRDIFSINILRFLLCLLFCIFQALSFVLFGERQRRVTHSQQHLMEEAPKMHEKMRSWKLTTHRLGYDLNQIARLINHHIQGWLNYFWGFYRQKVRLILDDVNRLLMRWAKKRYKKLKRRRYKAQMWLRRISKRDPNLFVMWRMNVCP